MENPRSHRRWRPRLIAAAIVALVAGALGVIGVTNAFAATSGTLVSSLNGKCLDVTNGSTANGNQPQLWTCAAGPNQTWTRADNGSIQLGRITQANLARMIGATRQSISLVLGRLQDDGIIATGPTKMIVNDLAALRQQIGD